MQRRLLDAGSSTRNLSVLLLASYPGRVAWVRGYSALSHEKELYNTNSPGASPVTVVRIIRAYVRVRVPRVAIRGRGLVEEIRYHHHYGVCKTFVVAAAATVYQESHF